MDQPTDEIAVAVAEPETNPPTAAAQEPSAPTPPDGAKKSELTLTHVAAVMVLVIIVSVAIAQSIGSGKSHTPSSGSVASMSVGSEGRLYVDETSVVPLAVDEQAYDELTKAMAARDYYGIDELVSSGRVLHLPPNTRVLVLEIGLFKKRVRILEGPSAGNAGYVAQGWVR